MNDIALTERLQLPAEPPEPEPKEEAFELVEYWRAVARYRWSILLFTIFATLTAALVVNSIRPSYKGTATLLIEQGKSKVVSIDEVYNQGFHASEYLQTQTEILKTEDIARKVVKELHLATHPDFDPRQEQADFLDKYVLRYIPFLPDRVAGGSLTEEAAQRIAVQRFATALDVQLVRNSQLVKISFVSYDRELAAKIPNAVANAFIESDLEARVAMTQKATDWLRERMAELRGKLDVAEKNLQDFREQQHIVDAKGLVQAGASRQLEQLMSNLTDARAKRIDVEATYNMAQQVAAGKGRANYDSIPAISRNPLVQRAKDLESDAEQRAAEASKRYGPEHPTMVKARTELESARENTRRQIDTAVAQLSREYEVARNAEAAIQGSLSQTKGELQSLNRKEFQLSVLERDVAQNRNLYDMFVNRLKETSATGDLQSTVARVIDPAVPPTKVYWPRRPEIIGAAALVALLLAAVFAVLVDRLSNTLNSTSGVEQRLGLPVLGVLHLIKGIRGKRGFISELAFFNDSQSAFAESVRTVRTSVLMSALDEPHKVIVVTSSVPEEGKTTVSYNLACALGGMKKVLLLDADMRRPKIGRLIGLNPRAPGLADLVAAQAPISECVVYNEKAGIYILPAGTVPPNPLELLSSQRFADMLTKIKQAFDVVVVDSAPLQLVSDSIILSQHASGIIYVVKADGTPYQVARNGLKRLRRAGAPILGAVLNQLDMERAEKYYGEYSGYSYKGYNKGQYRGYGKTYGRT